MFYNARNLFMFFCLIIRSSVICGAPLFQLLATKLSLQNYQNYNLQCLFGGDKVGEKWNSWCLYLDENMRGKSKILISPIYIEETNLIPSMLFQHIWGKRKHMYELLFFYFLSVVYKLARLQNWREGR